MSERKGTRTLANNAFNTKLTRPARDKAVAGRPVPVTDQRMTKETPAPLEQPSAKKGAASSSKSKESTPTRPGPSAVGTGATSSGKTNLKIVMFTSEAETIPDLKQGEEGGVKGRDFKIEFEVHL
jgi:hypothetical protein